MSKKPVVYFAGTMTGLTYEEMKEWRIKAARVLKSHGFEVLDPCERVDGGNFQQLMDIAYHGAEVVNTPAPEVVDSNVYHIARSSLVLAEFNFNRTSIGTIGEVVVAARELKKPVIAWGTNSKVHSYPWVKRHLTAHRDSLDDALAHIIEVYKGAE